MRRAGRALGVALWALTCAAGCTRSRATATDPSYLSVIVRQSPLNFDPRVGTDEISQRVHELVYSRLMVNDEHLRVAPGVAARLDNPDPLTYVAHLRHGVRFHDGHELTASDVVYTFESFLDPDFVSPRKGAYRMLASVTALDDYTVRFTLKEPFGSFPIQLVMPIVPAGAGDSLRAFPIGTGPYRFVRYLPDEQVELSAYEGYWDGLPLNAGVVLKIVPDETMRALELRKGTADLTVNDVSPDIAYELQRRGELHITEARGVDYTYIGLNLRDPVLADRRVRQAIAHAVDRDAIVKYLRRGLATPAVGILSPVAWAFEPSVPQFAHDVARAKALLDEAGYPDPDGDGPRPRLRLSLKTSTDEFYRLQATVLQQNLRQAGIDVDVRSYEFATFYADVLSGNAQMYTLQWVGVTDPDMLRRVFHSEQVPPVGFNRTYYRNPDVDRLIDLATRATTDEERLTYYRRVQAIVAEDVPYVSLWYKTNIAVMRPNVSGLRLTAQADFLGLKDVRKGTD
ncbi:MAG: ABC transporter substrate-binding protein [Acidobacteria bacterium]|nr:ABC transporter substrate-binding protein [Acidobacteriota bacterium]